MSIYHCSIQIIGRSSGRSAVAAAAYRTAEKLEDKETGLTHDYTKSKALCIVKLCCRNMLRKNIKIVKSYGMKCRKSKRDQTHS